MFALKALQKTLDLFDELKQMVSTQKIIYGIRIKI